MKSYEPFFFIAMNAKHAHLLLAAFLWMPMPILAQSAPLCRIEVVEKGSGWPVPLVELRTTHLLRYVSDNAGVIAFDAPELMGVETWFDVISPSYGVPKDGFGMRGVRLKPEPGKTLRFEVTRSSIARRLGRLTGGGLFAESERLDPTKDEGAESGLLGCDSVQNAVHNGKMFWAWGDTILPGYPMGLFDMSSATTDLRPFTSFEPPLRLKFDYFRDDKGKPRGVAKMPGSGPTWLSGYASLPDRSGRAHLVGVYIKVRGYLEAYESGMCVWKEEANQFEHLRTLWTKSEASPKQPPMPDGHPSLWKDPQGKEWLYFGNPFPTMRVPATYEAWLDPYTWEPLTPQAELAAADGAEKVVPHSGSIAWNAFRKRWLTIFMQNKGKPSSFGELWYAEAPAPTGPWGTAVKVLSHENYTFYNPRLHPEFTPAESPILLFEGTYTQQFVEKPIATPRYDYNQILYRLDLDDPKLKPAQP